VTQLTERDCTDFDRTIDLTPVTGEEGRFEVHLDAGWASLVGVHGGYMVAIAVRAAERVVPGRTVRTVVTTFLRTGQLGPATLTVRPVRAGRTIATVVTDLAQDGETLITSRHTLLADRLGVEWTQPLRPDLPPPAACVDFDPAGHVSHFGRVDSRFDPARLPFSGQQARVAGWVRPLEPRPVDAPWLAMATDWFPPPAFALLEPPTGGISVDLTTHLHRPGIVLSKDEWLAGAFEIRDSTGGLAVEHGRITTMDGTLVAESFQTRLTTQR
jgi:acyl-CoA thioesterase